MCGDPIDTWSRSCVVCEGSLFSEVMNVRAMMFGIGESFADRQCGDCGSSQIDRLPDDTGKYYPFDYYSHQDRKGVTDVIGMHMHRFGKPLGKVPLLHRLARSALGP